MARKGINAKGRREGGAFVAFPCAVLDSPNFSRLTPKGTKLLIDLCAQLRMKRGGPVNNGDLTIAWAIVKERGWFSKQSLYEAKDELTYYGLIELTRQGGKHVASLYAVTFFAINECGGKLDVRETVTASGLWKAEKPLWKSKRILETVARQSYQCAPPIVPIHANLKAKS